MNKLRVLDLFSGIGGFSLGLERTGGFETVAFCEIEEFPRKVLKKHWPKVPCYHDVRELTADRLAADGITPNVICGGFPCQDISLAGGGGGIKAERSGLWTEIKRLACELRPEIVFVENVAALLGRGIGDVLGDLAEIGYDAQWHCISASFLGACHHRDRVWIIAYPIEVGAGRSANSRFPFILGQSLERIFEEWAQSLHSNAGEIRRQGCLQKPISGQQALSWGKDCGSIEELIELASLHTPVLCRANDGISNRVDRVGSAGNAVVPQIPELIGRAILEARQAA